MPLDYAFSVTSMGVVLFLPLSVSLSVAFHAVCITILMLEVEFAYDLDLRLKVKLYLLFKPQTTGLGLIKGSCDVPALGLLCHALSPVEPNLRRS